MLLAFSAEETPCAVLFDVFKRQAHMSHSDLAESILSTAMLPDGRSVVAHAHDRSWLSRNVVHAPVDVAQARLFADFGYSGARLCMRLRSRRARPMGAEEIYAMVTSDAAREMDATLEAAGEDARPYRNLLERIGANREYSAVDRAELALVLFVAAGCSGSASTAVRYTLSYEQRAFGATSPTPPSTQLASRLHAHARENSGLHLGLIRVRDGYIVGKPHWVDPAGEGCVVGFLATGEANVCDAEQDVSSRHLHLWFEDGSWWAQDLDSANGTWLRPAGEDGERRLIAGGRFAVGPGDELRLAAFTSFMLVEGLPG